MKLGEFMIRIIDDMETQKDSYIVKKYLTHIHRLIKNRKDLVKVLFHRPIDWYGAGDLTIFLTRLRDLEERGKQGYPKKDVPSPPVADSDYIEIKTWIFALKMLIGIDRHDLLP